MEYGGEKSLNDLIEERNRDSRDPFPAAIILKVALNMARGLKVTMLLYLYIYFFKIYLLSIYLFLAASGLSCGTRDLF